MKGKEVDEGRGRDEAFVLMSQFRHIKAESQLLPAESLERGHLDSAQRTLVLRILSNKG